MWQIYSKQFQEEAIRIRKNAYKCLLYCDVEQHLATYHGYLATYHGLDRSTSILPHLTHVLQWVHYPLAAVLQGGKQE